MQFCSECGSMMRSVDGEMVCSSCGHTEAKDEDLASSFVSTEKQDESDVVETEEGLNFEGKPTSETPCPECENEEAYYTIKQTGSADEPPTRFFKCTECGARWREYA
ncbi:MAG: transcription factor S [Halodesulfurarchaeum sp.]